MSIAHVVYNRLYVIFMCEKLQYYEKKVSIFNRFAMHDYGLFGSVKSGIWR